MSAPWLASARYAAGFALSAAFNVGLVISLAELARPADRPDDHQPHAVAPSVVEPPPEPAASASPAPSESATPLPSAPAAPRLDLPAAPNLGSGPALAWGDLDDVGLGSLDEWTPGPVVDPRPSAPDRPPQLTVPPDLTRFYPQDARRRKLEGRTIVGLTVDTAGRVVAVEVLMSEPPGVFDRAAARAAKSFRFEPATKAGRPSLAETRLELKWQLPH